MNRGLDRRSRDEAAFGAAWRAFAIEDAGMQAPPDLERRVLERLHRRRSAAARSRPPRRAWLGVAATIGLTLAAMSWSGRDRARQVEALVAADVALMAPYKEKVTATPAIVPRVTRPRLQAVDRAVLAELPPALLSLGAGPLEDGEVLQLVRVRLPREQLQALGLVLVEPDAGGLVDIDVLVGEDGLARDIRQVRTGQE